MKSGTIYSASDKALFDALNQATVTRADLRQIFLSRGIIVSHQTPRKTLALHFSRLVHDYQDYQLLARLFGTGHRRERQASFRVVSKATIDNFEVATHELIDNIKKEGDAASAVFTEDGTLQISVRYKTVHFDKSEFKQVVTRNAVITVEKDGDALVLRGPQNDKVDTWCRIMLSDVEGQIDGPLDIDEISLESEPDPATRSRFFYELIDNLLGYRKHDVTDVYVFKPKLARPCAGDPDDDDPDTVDLGVHISRASLKGEGVLQSDELKGLVMKGFYISKIVWQAKNSQIDSDLFEFEAQFSEPETCTRFSYLTHGYYKYLAPKEFAVGRTQLPTEDDREFSKLIEAAARKALQAVKNPGALVQSVEEPSDEDKVV